MFRDDHEARGRRAIHIGLVNNMADAALLATERQFARALGVGAPGSNVRLHRLFMPAVPRGPEAATHIAAHYRDVATLDETGIDGLIVTGSEPREPDLRREPYWDSFRSLVDWAGRNTASTLWSCMAAHAAVLHLHGVERTRLERKCSGVFTITGKAGAVHDWRAPHSRLNTLIASDLTAHGYDIVAETAGAGVDSFRLDAGSRFLFLQGHPEYEAQTLRAEYQRDFKRYLRGERPAPPAIPAGYFDAPTSQGLAELQSDADDLILDAALARLNHILAEAGIVETWEPYRNAVYGGWLAGIAQARRGELVA